VEETKRLGFFLAIVYPGPAIHRGEAVHQVKATAISRGILTV